MHLLILRFVLLQLLLFVKLLQTLLQQQRYCKLLKPQKLTLFYQDYILFHLLFLEVLKYLFDLSYYVFLKNLQLNFLMN